MLLIKNAELYAPARLGRRDILIAGESIVAIAGSIPVPASPVVCEVIDAAGRAVAPGFIDGHVHITGGGGEGGFRTRTPELRLSDATMAGVTTVIGVLGTDGVARSLEALVAKAYGLREEGLSAWCYTGAYRVPLVTITGDIMKDIMMIDPILGAGEVAISDHRSSRPSDEELARVAMEARVGGMLSGKAGLVNVHLGDAPDGLGPLQRIAVAGDVPRTQFLPTHCNRNPSLFLQSVQWAREGGRVDYTASAATAILEGGEINAAESVARIKSGGISLERVTVTSDGQGSLPSFDAEGRLNGLSVGTCSSLLDYLREAVGVRGLALEEALGPITSNPAEALKLVRKGRVEEGLDADLVIFGEGLVPDCVIARGRVMVRDGRPVVLGTFERQG
ncbi:MAG: beta-aspartyl-peptidase [Spirochaetia bacterium]|jgi:beta-aspartyl-dipeptidase (metallo-type)|nr:beta-aspartyl-peptidase [Spirochaetia bacterium]